MPDTDEDDDISRLRRHCRALEAELDVLWGMFGQLPPLRRDSGGTSVGAIRNDAGRRVFDRGAQ